MILPSRWHNWAGYYWGPAMGLVLGAESCRYLGPDAGGDVFGEPAVCWRHRTDHTIYLNGASIGTMTTQTLICKGTDHELARPLKAPSLPDEYTLRCFLGYFRGRLAGHRRGKFPGKLIVTGRWDLRKALDPMLAAAGRAVGFRSCRTVDESDALGREIGTAAPGLTLAADVGHLATRLYAWRGGSCLGVAGMTNVGGRQALRAILGAMEKRGLLVGDGTTRWLFALADATEGAPGEVGGRDLASGLPRCVEVRRAEIVAALEPVHAGIADTCRAAIARFEGAAGEPVRLVLTGGGAGRRWRSSSRRA